MYFEDFCDMVKEITSDTAKLCGNLAETNIRAFQEFVADPVKYTSESIEEISDVVSSFAQTDCKDTPVKPVPGSVVYCRLWGGVVEHSGIYTGESIIHLNGNGLVESVMDKEFIKRLKGLGFAENIYVSSCFGKAVGCEDAVKRAHEKLWESRKYNILLDNCHQFVSGCVTGDFENADNFMWMLKDTCKKKFGAKTWNLYQRK
jgi:hypothetical protein